MPAVDEFLAILTTKTLQPLFFVGVVVRAGDNGRVHAQRCDVSEPLVLLGVAEAVVHVVGHREGSPVDGGDVAEGTHVNSSSGTSTSSPSDQRRFARYCRATALARAR